MISRDEPMALVVTKDGQVKTICYLGHATLDGNEMHRISYLAEQAGCYAYTNYSGGVLLILRLYLCGGAKGNKVIDRSF